MDPELKQLFERLRETHNELSSAYIRFSVAMANLGIALDELEDTVTSDKEKDI